MDAHTVINLGLLACTVIAAAVAAWQALDARGARNAAATASAEASKQAPAAVLAAERSALAAEESASSSTLAADALERQASVAEATQNPLAPRELSALGTARQLYPAHRFGFINELNSWQLRERLRLAGLPMFPCTTAPAPGVDTLDFPDDCSAPRGPHYPAVTVHAQ